MSQPRAMAVSEMSFGDCTVRVESYQPASRTGQMNFVAYRMTVAQDGAILHSLDKFSRESIGYILRGMDIANRLHGTPTDLADMLDRF